MPRFITVVCDNHPCSARMENIQGELIKKVLEARAWIRKNGLDFCGVQCHTKFDDRYSYLP